MRGRCQRLPLVRRCEQILLRCWWAMQESGQVYVIGAGDCGQLGVGEDDVEALRARLSPVASGAKARLLVAAS